MAKLTAEEIAEIERMGQEGVAISEIAAKFGVTQTAVTYHLDKDYQERLKEQVKKRSKNLYDNDEYFRQHKKDLYKNFLKSHRAPRNERYPTVLDIFWSWKPQKPR